MHSYYFSLLNNNIDCTYVYNIVYYVICLCLVILLNSHGYFNVTTVFFYYQENASWHVYTYMYIIRIRLYYRCKSYRAIANLGTRQHACVARL